MKIEQLGNGFECLGILTPDELKDLYPKSAIVSNMQNADAWGTLVDNLYDTNPEWYMFTNPVYRKECYGIQYLFQLGMYAHANNTGLGLLGEDFLTEYLVPISVESYAKEVLEQIHVTGFGHAITNARFLTSYHGSHPTPYAIPAKTDVVYLCEDSRIDIHLELLTSKKRNSCKKSLALCEELTVGHIRYLKPHHVAWLLMHTVNNFGESGSGLDNSYALEASMHQWTTLLNHESNIYFQCLNNKGELVAMLSFLERGITGENSSEAFDFLAFCQDRTKGTGVGTGILLKSLEALSSWAGRDVTVFLNTAPAPGEDYDPYSAYKKNVANSSMQVYSVLASNPNEDLADYYTHAYNSKLGKWV